MTDVLKPCPFCGGEGKKTDTDGGIRISCADCWFSVTTSTWNIRSDLAEAQIAAAYEAALRAIANESPGNPEGSVGDEALHCAYNAVIALTPSSAKTALDALLQAERCEATHTVSYHGPDGESGDFVFSSLDEASAFTSALRKMPGFQVVDHVERAMSTAQSAIAAIRNINEGEG